MSRARGSGADARRSRSPRQQVELLGPADRRPPVVDAELGVDVLGVGPHGVERHEQLAGDLRAVQVGAEQPEDVELAGAQRVDHALLPRPASSSVPPKAVEEPADVAPRRSPARGQRPSRAAIGGPSSTKIRT